MKFALVSVVVCLSVGLSFGANPNYSYHIKIDDPAHANYQEKAETRKGPDAQGFYSVVEPNGALRTVSYTADDRGFNPIVQYSHAGSSVFSSIGTYAPAYVSEKRVQIVDKLTGPPPALNIQPFALPAPSGYAASAPVVVPAPLRVAPAPQLIAQAQGVNYAPAFMPPVTAFASGPSPVVYQPQQTYIQQQVAPAPQVVYQQPQLIQKQVFQPQQVVYQQPIVQKQVIQPQVVYQQPQLIQKQVVQPQVVYQQPQVVYKQPQLIQKQVIQPQQVVYQQPIVQKQVVYQQPIVQKQVVQKQVALVAPPTKLVTPVVTDSYLPPKNTVIDSSAPVYPEAKKPEAAYGPPSFTPGEPIGLVETPAPVKVAVAKPVIRVQQYQPVVQKAVVQQYQPVVQKVVQPAPQVFVQQQQYQPVVQKVVQQAPQVLVQQKTVAPAPIVGLYAGAIGYHTQNSAPNAYLHSYGTQGFQVTSSRTFNKAVLPVPQLAVQSAPLLQQVVKQPVYAPQYYQPAPAPLAIAQPAVAVQAAAPVAQVQYGPPAVQYGVPAPQYGVPAVSVAAAPAKLIQSAPVAVAAPIAGKKQNPLTFAYSYDQGGAKVSHSYSGSGW